MGVVCSAFLVVFVPFPAPQFPCIVEISLCLIDREETSLRSYSRFLEQTDHLNPPKPLQAGPGKLTQLHVLAPPLARVTARGAQWARTEQAPAVRTKPVATEPGATGRIPSGFRVDGEIPRMS